MLLARPIRPAFQCTWKFSLAAALWRLCAGLRRALAAVRLDAARADDTAARREGRSKHSPQRKTRTAVKPADTRRNRGDNKEPPMKRREDPLRPKSASASDLPLHRASIKKRGEGVPNATVTVERSDSSVGHWPFKQVAKTTHVTDAEGKFTVEIPPEQSGNSHALHPDLRRARRLRALFRARLLAEHDPQERDGRRAAVL